jgi:hypothetical protein
MVGENMLDIKSARRTGHRWADGLGDRVVRRALWRSCANRLTVFGSAAVAAGGLALQSPELCVLAIGGYVAAVAFDLRRPALWRRAADELRRERVALPSICRYDDAITRELLLRLERARNARDAALDRLPDGDREPLQSLLAQAAALEELAVQMLDAFDRLAVYIGPDPMGPLMAQQQRLEHANAADGGDPEVQREYQRALAAVAQRISSVHNLSRWRALLKGKLEGVTGLLETLPTTLVETELRRSSAGILSSDLPLDLVSEELRALHDGGIAMLEPPPACTSG